MKTYKKIETNEGYTYELVSLLDFHQISGMRLIQDIRRIRKEYDDDVELMAEKIAELEYLLEQMEL